METVVQPPEQNAPRGTPQAYLAEGQNLDMALPGWLSCWFGKYPKYRYKVRSPLSSAGRSGTLHVRNSPNRPPHPHSPPSVARTYFTAPRTVQYLPPGNCTELMYVNCQAQPLLQSSVPPTCICEPGLCPVMVKLLSTAYLPTASAYTCMFFTLQGWQYGRAC
jgi:hypothetical protein